MYLDDRVIPSDIIEKFEAAFVRDSIKTLPAATYDLAHILEGTKYLTQSSKTFEADIFKAFG
jgi:hypothetical protein